MNELPDMKDQIKDYMYSEPSPFVHYDEAGKKFLQKDNDTWKLLCMQKFDWIRRTIEQGLEKVTPQSLAAYSDDDKILGKNERSLEKYLLQK